MTRGTIIGNRKQMEHNKFLVIIGVVLATLFIITMEGVYAQEYSIDKKEKYPLAFNQTGHLKNYDDCGYNDKYLTPVTVDNIIIEYSFNDTSDDSSNTDLTSYGGIDLGLFGNYEQYEDKLDLENITQAQVDCLIDIREVEKSKEYKDCGYDGVNTSQAVDQRLSELSMKTIPTTENKTQKEVLQQEADCLVDIRSLEKQTAKYNQEGGKYQDYEIIDGEVVKKTKPTPNIQGGLDAMVTDLKNDGEALKAEIASTNLYKTGLVEDLIYKVAYYEGQISVMGGGTWAYLHDVQDTLLAKIKATDEDGFTTTELASIDYFATGAAQSKIEHPSTNVFG
ncbi:hypothetical protein [Candidatus Nitrosocosmicus sp. T]